MDHIFKACLVTFILLSLTSFSMSEDLSGNRFLKASCNTSELGTCKDLLCNITSFGALNFGFTIARELETFDVQIFAYINKNGVYQQIVKYPKINWCDFVSGSRLNPFYKMLLHYLKTLAPKMVTPCPYLGKYYFYNLTSLSYSMFPTGKYKVTFQLSDAIDKNIYRLTYHSSLDTLIKFDGK